MFRYNNTIERPVHILYLLFSIYHHQMFVIQLRRATILSAHILYTLVDSFNEEHIQYF